MDDQCFFFSLSDNELTLGGLHHASNKYSGSPIDDKLETLAGNIFGHCNMALSQHNSAPYELPKYPIEEDQQKRAIERQMSHKWV